MRKPKRILGYARVSSQEQALGTSLGDQQATMRRHAESLGLKVDRFYIEAESAIHEKIERREQMLSLMKDVKAGDLVLCDKLDRWSRDPEFTYGSVRKILSADASFYAVSDRCDPSTSEGDTALGFRILFAREEHKRIKERMVGTRNILRSRGYYAAGIPPLGYKRPDPNPGNRLERNVLVVVPEEAELVRRIFKMYVSGWSMTKLARELDLKLDRVKDVLHRRVYLGEVQGPPSAPGRLDGEWIKGHHEPIVTHDLFWRAQEIIKKRTLGGPRPRDAISETSTWILRDIARCGLCEAKMGAAYAGPKDARRYYYRCTKKCNRSYVSVKTIETAIGSMIVGRLAELREELSRPIEQPKMVAIDYVQQKERLEKKRERMLELYADGVTTREHLNRQLAKLDSERLKLEAKEASAAAPPRLQDKGVRREVLASVDSLKKVWKLATPQERRRIVGILASAVHIENAKPPRPVWISVEELSFVPG